MKRTRPANSLVSIPGSCYSNDQRRYAVACFVVLGNLRKVSQVTHIPDSTLSDWTRTEWWNALVGEVRNEKNAELDAELSATLKKAVAVVNDRLDRGDALLHQGEVKRVPMKGKDAAVVAAIAFDKRQLLRSMPTAITGNGEERLEKIAKRLQDWFAKQRQTFEGEAKV